jgi:hypothetical protein
MKRGESSIRKNDRAIKLNDPSMRRCHRTIRINDSSIKRNDRTMRNNDDLMRLNEAKPSKIREIGRHPSSPLVSCPETGQRAKNLAAEAQS